MELNALYMPYNKGTEVFMKKIRTWFHDPLHQAMAAVFLLLFFLNLLTVLTSDDFIYANNSGFLDLFAREYHQYMTWTGRSVAHIMARSMLAMPKIVFDLANSAMFVLACWLINAIAEGRGKRVKPGMFLLTAALVFLLVPFPGQTILWEAGSCNYLWTSCIVLSFLLQYRYAFEESKTSWKRTVLLFLYGMAAGWTNENTGGAMILLVMILMFFLWKEQKLRSWMVSGLHGSCIGLLLMIRAPGNAVRGADFTFDPGLAYSLTHSMSGVLKVLFTTDRQLLLWILLSVLTYLSIAFGKERKEIRTAWVFAFCSAAAVAAMIATRMPVYYDRSMFGSTILLITAVMILLKNCETIPWMSLLSLYASITSMPL